MAQDSSLQPQVLQAKAEVHRSEVSSSEASDVPFLKVFKTPGAHMNISSVSKVTMSCRGQWFDSLSKTFQFLEKERKRSSGLRMFKSDSNSTTSLKCGIILIFF